MNNLLSRKYVWMLLFFSWAFVSCISKEYVTIPRELETQDGQNIDSLIRSNQYTALVFFDDNCGVNVPNLNQWNKITDVNPNIHPLIIAKIVNEKKFVALFEVLNMRYPYVFDNDNRVRKANHTIDFYGVILVDSTGLVLNKVSPIGNKMITKVYQKIYR